MKILRIALTALMLVLLSELPSAFTPEAYAEANRGGGVPFENLPQELKELEIKDYFVPSSFKKVGVIHALEGSVAVIHRATKEAYFGRAGDHVYENDSLNTLADSRCRVKFFNEDVVTMAADTEFSVESFHDQRKEGKRRSLFSMFKGKAMFYAMRLFRYKDTRFRVRTPTITIGVRGTKFGAHVYWVDGAKSVDAGVKVADRGDGIGMYLAEARPGGGGGSYTDCHSEDGFLDVDGKVVGPGEMYKGDTGEITPTPPGVVKGFAEETDVKTEKEKKEEKTKEEEKVEKEVGGELVIGAGEEASYDSAANQTENQADTVQLETGSETEKENLGTFFDHGYFTAMLKLLSGGNEFLEDVFISDRRQAFTLPPGIAKSIVDAAPNEDELRFDGDEASNIGGFVNVEINGTSHDINVTAEPVFIKALNFLDYGYWHLSGTFTTGPDQYEFVDHAWWIRVLATPDASMSMFSGSVGYSGDAHGTYFDTDGNTELMKGSFSCDVDFDTASVNNFDVSVSGANHNAVITGGSGAFSSSQFDINNASGSWEIDNIAASYKGAHGTLAGESATEIGGVWGMKVPIDTPTAGDPARGAAGIFAGSSSQ